jgi:hypothetical protein
MNKQNKKLLKTFEEKIRVGGRQQEMDSFVERGVPEAIWLAWELVLLKGMDDKMIHIINETKKVFPGAVIHV